MLILALFDVLDSALEDGIRPGGVTALLPDPESASNVIVVTSRQSTSDPDPMVLNQDMVRSQVTISSH